MPGGACPTWDAENVSLSTLESPAHTQHDLAGHQVGLHLLVLQAAGIREVVPATFGIAHVDVAIAEIQGQAIRHVVGNAGAEGPGQVGLGRGTVLARLVTLPALRLELGQAFASRPTPARHGRPAQCRRHPVAAARRPPRCAEPSAFPKPEYAVRSSFVCRFHGARERHSAG